MILYWIWVMFSRVFSSYNYQQPHGVFDRYCPLRRYYLHLFEWTTFSFDQYLFNNFIGRNEDDKKGKKKYSKVEDDSEGFYEFLLILLSVFHKIIRY